MSGIINKAKDAMHGGNSTSTTHTTHGNNSNNNNSLPEGTVGPHGRLGNAADPRIDSDLDSKRHAGHQTHSPATGLNNSAATHSQVGGSALGQQSNVPVVGAHSHGSGVGGTPFNTTGGSAYQTGHNTTGHSATAGVHRSDNLNRLDPTVDSDLSGGNHLGAQSDSRTAAFNSGSNDPYSSTGGQGSHLAGQGVHNGNSGIGHQSNVGSSGLGSQGVHNGNSALGHQSNVGSSGLGNHGASSAVGASSHQNHNNATTAGSHNSNLLNKADPMIDSDLSGGKHMGLQSDAKTAGYSGAGSNTGAHTGNTALGHQSNTGTSGLGSSGIGSNGTNTGSHTGTGAGYSTFSGPGTGLGHSGHSAAGTSLGHSTQTAGAGTGVHSTGTSGLNSTTGTHNTGSSALNSATGIHANPADVGPAPKTAGPHKSDMLNKLDPRVDSDLSGGKTFGGDKTHA